MEGTPHIVWWNLCMQWDRGDNSGFEVTMEHVTITYELKQSSSNGQTLPTLCENKVVSSLVHRTVSAKCKVITNIHHVQVLSEDEQTLPIRYQNKVVKESSVSFTSVSLWSVKWSLTSITCRSCLVMGRCCRFTIGASKWEHHHQ